MTSFYYLSSKRYKNPGKINKVGKKNGPPANQDSKSKKSAFLQVCKQNHFCKGRVRLVVWGCGRGGGAGTPEILAHVYELARTHKLLQMTREEGGIPSFHSLSRGKSSASCLQSLYDLQRHTPPSARSHGGVEVAAGKTGWVRWRWIRGWWDGETSVGNECNKLKKGNKNDNETHTQTDTHTDAHTGCEGWPKKWCTNLKTVILIVSEWGSELHGIKLKNKNLRFLEREKGGKEGWLVKWNSHCCE